MLSITMILTVIAVVVVLVILFKLLGLITAALGIFEKWGQIIYWVLVLIAVVWLFGVLGIMQPLIR